MTNPSIKHLMAGAVLAAVAVTALPAAASNVAIVKGGFYTSYLHDSLVAAGETVTEISSYSAASLAAYDAVIHYGNSFTDTVALDAYVNGGGRLILTPWSGLNYAVPADLQVFDNGGGADFQTSFPGATILAPGDSLLAGVNFPDAHSLTIGRISRIGFAAGAVGVANYGDGDAFLGHRNVGAGKVFGINLHLITSDSNPQVAATPWATRVVVNAIGGGAAVPEPTSWALMLVGFGGIGSALRAKRRWATATA